MSIYPLFRIEVFAATIVAFSSNTSIAECDRNIVSIKVVPDLGKPTKNIGICASSSIIAFVDTLSDFNFSLLS